MSAERLIVVCGATGNQGGAVVRQLLAYGNWQVRGLTRDTNKLAARTLTEMGVQMVRADMEDRASLEHAFTGAEGVFSVQNYWKVGYEAEVRQGKNVGDAAHAAGVKRFIYSSVGGADRNTGLAHFESKWEIEQHVRRLGMPYTIFRPVFWMDNLNGPEYRESILSGTLPMGLSPDRKLQMISLEDIGRFVALAFANPDHYLNHAYEIAGDELTMPETAEEFSRVLGRPVRFQQVPIEQIRQQSKDWAEMLEWFERYGYRANIPELRQMNPELVTFSQWLDRSGWAELARRREAA